LTNPEFLSQTDIRAAWRSRLSGPVGPSFHEREEQRREQIREASAARLARAADREASGRRLLAWLETELGGRDGALSGNRWLLADAISMIHNAGVAISQDRRDA
jgi:hypothetical protein